MIFAASSKSPKTVYIFLVIGISEDEVANIKTECSTFEEEY